MSLITDKSPEKYGTDSEHLALHDALPIYHRLQAVQDRILYACAAGCEGLLRLRRRHQFRPDHGDQAGRAPVHDLDHRSRRRWRRSEEHTSELQSREKLVCRLMLEKIK